MLRSLEPIALAFLLAAAAALAGMRLYGGLLRYCSSDMLPFGSQLVTPTTTLGACGASPSIVVGDSCALLPTVAEELVCRQAAGGAPLTPVVLPYPVHFDDFGHALLTGFELLSGQNWPVFARQYMSATDAVPGAALPTSSGAGVTSAFFMVAELLLQHFATGLFGGFVARTFFTDRAITLGLGVLSAPQRVWVENLRAALRVRAPRALRPAPSASAAVGALRRRLFAALHHPAAEHFITLVVVMNMLVVGGQSANEAPATTAALAMASNVFTVIFLVELLLRVAVLGLGQFLARSVWDSLDAAATVLSCATLFASNNAGLGNDAASTIYVFARLLRVLRVFRVAFRLRGVRRVLVIIGEAAPAVLNVLAMHALLVYMFAVAGMNVFEGVRYGWMNFMDPVDANFDSFFAAFTTLWRCTTGENFNGIMHDLMPRPPFCVEGVNCGRALYSVPFFVTFYIVTRFLCIQLIVAIMMHALTNIGSTDASTGMRRLTHDLCEAFADEWGVLDPDATHVLPRSRVILLLCRLPPPLGVAADPEEEGAGIEGADAGVDGAAATAPDRGADGTVPSLAHRSRARLLFEELHLPHCDVGASAAAQRASLEAIVGPNASLHKIKSFARLALGSLRALSRRTATSETHAATTPATTAPPSPAVTSPSTPAGSARGTPSASRNGSARSTVAPAPPVHDATADEPVFQFHTVLYSLMAHANRRTIPPATVEMSGHHVSGVVSIRAMMIMKRVFRGFRARRAARLKAASALAGQ